MHVDLFLSTIFVKERKLEPEPKPKDGPKWSSDERSLDAN